MESSGKIRQGKNRSNKLEGELQSQERDDKTDFRITELDVTLETSRPAAPCTVDNPQVRQWKELVWSHRTRRNQLLDACPILLFHSISSTVGDVLLNGPI